MIRIFRHYVPRSLVILGTSEALIFFGSIYLGMSLGFGFSPADELRIGPAWPKGVVYATLMLVVMASVGLYQRGMRDDVRGLMLRIGVAFLVGLVILGAMSSVAPRMGMATPALGQAFVYSVIGVVVFRLIVYRYLDTGFFKRRVMVLGTGELASQVERLRRRSDWRDMVLVGYVPVPGEDRGVDERKVFRPRSSLLDLCREHDVEELVVGIEEQTEHFPISQILDCKMSGVQVMDLVAFFERANGKINIDALKPTTMIFADGFVHSVVKGYAHRALDLLVCALVLAVTWPVMCLTALAIVMESGGRGPVLYRQVRVGRKNRHFAILKFRSMAVDAEASGEARWASASDGRITRVGSLIRKLRIDELPQLINVLKGDMSFVGPRPERPAFVAALARRIPYYNLRHRVNPGITGWAQICYPYGASEHDAKEKLEYDLYYIKNYTLFLDVMILIQTAQVILWGKGAR